MSDPLGAFQPVTRAWFTSNFAAPTPAQAGAWNAIAAGENVLVVAPTGSGKTLAAFLSALDTLAHEPRPDDKSKRCRVLYVSPLKALAVDVERNLRAPLAGMTMAADRLGLSLPDIRVATRTGDTPQAERRRFLTNPADILITTPESLFLLLTSGAREMLTGIETVILDEVHAVAGSKRGAHLALSLERLDALLEHPAQRIGLSATVRPISEIQRYLGGSRPTRLVDPPSTKTWDLTVTVPVPDMSDGGGRRPLDKLGEHPSGLGEHARGFGEYGSGPGEHSAERKDDTAGARRRGTAGSGTIWPDVEEQITDLIAAHHSTLVFCNSRRLAERLTARINEIWDARQRPEQEAAPATRTPAEMMAQSGRSEGAPPVLARAHHGSVSKDEREEIETALKTGRLPAVVATSSLELGIDMGAVDLVIQVEAPPSVASGLQRVGRAGHQVGATSTGVLFPKFRGDLIATAVVTERMESGQIEALHLPRNPLDVLAQQLVAMVSMDDLSVADIAAIVRRAASFSSLPDPLLHATLDMLSGRYPSDEFAELRPRLVWDRSTGVVSARPGANRLAIMSGGTIPDRGMYGVFLAGAEGPGRRVGELDEEMVYESRVGDVFALGSSSWRIEEITHDRVLVTPAPGQAARLPFWKGDSLGRPAELGAAHGAFIREISRRDDAARTRLSTIGLDDWASQNLLDYLAEQEASIPRLPTDTTLVLERFRDELGDWRVCLHSPYGGTVHAPWALAIRGRLRERFGVEIDAMPTDDGIVFRMPAMDEELHPTWAREMAELVLIPTTEIADSVTAELGGSPVFAARFRECAARALLLPKQRPDKRQPLWQQRLRSAQLLSVASQYPSFPIMLETVREVLHDLFDVPALEELLTRLERREVQLVEVETPQPSPFARTLAFGYIGQFMYEGDQPLAERKAAALSLDPQLLAELLGRPDGASLRDLLDPDACRTIGDELQWLTDERKATRLDDIADLLRVLGPLTAAELAKRSSLDPQPWIDELLSTRRIISVGISGLPKYASVEDSSRLRDALGVLIPPGVAETLLTPSDDPLGSLIRRYARTHLPFTPDDVAAEFGLGTAVVSSALDRLVAEKRVIMGEFLPDELSSATIEFADPDVIRRLRRRSLAALRAEVEAVPAVELARFLPRWHGLSEPHRGLDAVLDAVEQLAGYQVPASAVETLILPARVGDYQPRYLDDLLQAGEILWQGHAPIGRDDGWISLHLADSAPLTLAASSADLSLKQQALADAASGLGAWLAPHLAAQLERPVDSSFADDLWALVWHGLLSSDGFGAVRNLLGGGKTAHRTRQRAGRVGRVGGSLGARAVRPSLPSLTGRWLRLPDIADDGAQRLLASLDLALDRDGILTRGAVERDDFPGGFSQAARILRAAEEAGRVRRGYFVEGLGASQFASTAAVDRLRAQAASPAQADQPISALAHLQPAGPAEAYVLAATDPANAYGSALPWPETAGGHKPGRKAGGIVVVVAGELVLYLERGGKTLLSFTENAGLLQRAATALAEAVARGALGTLKIATADGAGAVATASPVTRALEHAGFRMTPSGLTLRGEHA